MTKMYKAGIRGLGESTYGRVGVWLTEDELEIVLTRQYDEKLSRKVVHLGGKFFKPEAFMGVIEEQSLKELAESGSPSFDSNLIKSLAKSGHLQELREIQPPGYTKLVNRLVESGQYKLEEKEKKRLDG